MFLCQQMKNVIIQSRLPRTKKLDSRMAPNSAPVDPQTQNPLYLALVDPQSPNSLYSALGEREHKTRARVKISVSEKNKPLCTTFSKTHSQTWRIHVWIPNDLSQGRKLVRSQTTVRIWGFFHFSNRFTNIVRNPIEVKFPHLQPAVNCQPLLLRG